MWYYGYLSKNHSGQVACALGRLYIGGERDWLNIMLVCVEMARTRGSIILSILSACRREMQKISNQEGAFVLRSWRSALSMVS
jgi:hypothetical protein